VVTAAACAHVVTGLVAVDVRLPNSVILNGMSHVLESWINKDTHIVRYMHFLYVHFVLYKYLVRSRDLRAIAEDISVLNKI
jgi:hypothetical protein